MESFHGSVDLSDVPIDDVKKNLGQTVSLGLSIDKE